MKVIWNRLWKYFVRSNLSLTLSLLECKCVLYIDAHVQCDYVIVFDIWNDDYWIDLLNYYSFTLPWNIPSSCKWRQRLFYQNYHHILFPIVHYVKLRWCPYRGIHFRQALVLNDEPKPFHLFRIFFSFKKLKYSMKVKRKLTYHRNITAIVGLLISLSICF